MPKPELKEKPKTSHKLYKRKEERKLARKSKKQKKANFFLAKSGKAVEVNKSESRDGSSGSNPKKKHQLTPEELEEQKQERRVQEELRQRKLEQDRKKKERAMHKIAAEQEEKVIKQMEKKLKLNKRRKKNTLPQSFYDEGLGDVLDFIDKRNQDEASEKADEELLKKPTKIEKKDVAAFSDDEMDEDEFEAEFGGGDDEEGDDFGLMDSEEGDEEDSDEDMDEEGEVSVAEEETDGTWQDIYGRTRDKKGNVIESGGEKQSKPEAVAEYTQEDIDKDLLRKIRGQLNRVTSSNLPGISTFLEGLYKTNSFFQMNEGVCRCIRDLIVVDINLSPLKLINELTMLLAALHENVGEEVGGHAVHFFVKLFEEHLRDEDNEGSKKLDNSVAVLTYLYAAGLLDPELAFDIIDELVTIFDEKCIELIVFVLIAIGFILRKDNPSRMKELVLKTQRKAEKFANDDNVIGKRVEYMLETLNAVKNNNMLKIASKSGVVSPIERETIRSVLKNCLKRTHKVSFIPGRYKKVLLSNRWWIKVGTLLELNEEDKEAKRSLKQTMKDLEMDTDVDERLCRALRLNTTPLRKLLFKALITSSDYLEATERLSQLGNKQFPEVANVVVHVALHEKTFNPFYVHLLKNLAHVDRKFKIAIQFAVRDKIADLESLSERLRSSLDELVFQLMRENVISITALKVIEFGDINETCVTFLRNVIGKILNEDETKMQEILSKIPKKDAFASAIRLFINCFMDDNMSERNKELIRATIKRRN